MPETQQIEKDTEGTVSFLPQPERNGYTFDGWSENKDALEAQFKVTGNKVLMDSNKTLYAIWKENVAQLSSTTFRENGTYDVSTYGEVTVDVPQNAPTGTLSITENGTKDVTNYASVNVNVSNIYENIADYYGKRVKYNAGTGQTDITNNTWRLFYVDFCGDFGEFRNIYLKADPIEQGTSCSTTYDSSQTLVKKLNPQWAEARGNSTWKNNEKAAAWVCDPTKWSQYASTAYGSGIVKYAIGSPSVEMFMKAYAEKANRLGFEAKYFANGSTAYGYKYKTSDTNDNSYYDYDTGDFEQNLISPVGIKDIIFGSPSCQNANSLCRADAGAGSEKFRMYYYPYSSSGEYWCPLVCLSPDFEIEILGD